MKNTFPNLTPGDLKKIKSVHPWRPKYEAKVLYYESSTGQLKEIPFVLDQFRNRKSGASNVVFEDDPLITGSIKNCLHKKDLRRSL